MKCFSISLKAPKCVPACITSLIFSIFFPRGVAINMENKSKGLLSWICADDTLSDLCVAPVLTQMDEVFPKGPRTFFQILDHHIIVSAIEIMEQMWK
jgi:hypothetical protein